MRFTKQQAATLAALTRNIEYAPRHGVTCAPGLMGWRTTDDLYICVSCASRILARGCSLPTGVQPVWETGCDFKPGVCVTCVPPDTIDVEA